MIKSLQKAMALLSVISDGRGEPVRIMDISEKTGIPRPSCAHILETLAHDGYVVRLSHTDGYVLGPSLYHLTRSGRYDERLVALSRPILHSIEKRSGGTVILSVIKGGHKFIIDYLDGEQNVFPERQRIITDEIYTKRDRYSSLGGREAPFRKAFSSYPRSRRNGREDW